MEQIPQLMVQSGALGLFVWYTMQNNREWRQYLTERNSKLEKALDKLSETLDKTLHDSHGN